MECLDFHHHTSIILSLLFVLLIIPINYAYANHETETGPKCYESMDGNYCNLLNQPFEAISNAFMKEWIGDWYLVLMFIPFPISIIIITKNFTYGGFIGFIMTGGLITINQTAFEIALTLVAISTGLVFVETIYKRVFD